MLISKSDFKSIINIAMIGILIFATHYGLHQLFPRHLYAHNVFYIHPFLLTITLASMIAVKIIFKNVRDNILGYVFLFTSLIKMFASVFFLLPVIRNESLFRKEYIAQFFMIYFIYLGVEVYYLVRNFKNENG